MRILFLCEGDAESATGSFSGTSKSLVDHLRGLGHEVVSGDVDLYGAPKLVAALSTFSARRPRWAARYHLGAVPFALRSRRAGAIMQASRSFTPDAVLQIGATFRLPAAARVPRFVYCDSNIRMAERGAASGYSDGSFLTRAELEGVARRESAVYRGAERVFAISALLQRSFIDDFGVAPERAVAAYAGANLDLGRIPERQVRPLAAPTILFVGVQFERKGGDALLRAFARLRQRHPGARLIVIGPRQFPHEAPGVEWWGYLRKEVPEEWARLVEAYSAADAFCLPTRYEPFGIAFIEAMMFGLPCVGTRTGAVSEMVQDGETGFLVDVDDEEAMADRLDMLARDPALRGRLGKAGRAFAESRFTWPAIVRRMATEMEAGISEWRDRASRGP